MTTMSRTVKSAIFFSVIGIATGVGIMLLIIDDQTLRGIFRPLVGESSNNKLGDNSLPFAVRENYKASNYLVYEERI